MVKPLYQFGGLLRLFYLGHWAGLIVLSLFLLCLLILMVGSITYVELIEVVIHFVELLIYIELLTKITKRLKTFKKDSPNNIVLLARLIVFFGGIFLICKGAFYYIVQGPQGLYSLFYSAKSFVLVVMYYLGITLYYRKSKRVFIYYGKTAEIW